MTIFLLAECRIPSGGATTRSRCNWFAEQMDDENDELALDEAQVFGFLVLKLKGSLCRREVVASAKRFFVDSARNRLIESGVLADHNDTQYIFTEDYIFNTPSGASAVILGRSSNGWIDWKNDQGQTLHEIKRSTGDSEANSEQ